MSRSSWFGRAIDDSLLRLAPQDSGGDVYARFLISTGSLDDLYTYHVHNGGAKLPLRVKTLPLFLLAIKISIEFVVEPLASIIESHLLIESIDFLHILGIQLEISPQIRFNARRCLGLRDDRMTM